MLVKSVGLLALACWVMFPRAVRAQGSCESESGCSFKKPNVLLVLDYSSSMTGAEGAPAFFPPGQTATTRWIAELDAASWILRYDRGFFADHARIALSRFAHDPLPMMPGTTIGTDRSFPAITDGFAIDVPFDGSQGAYLECKGSGVEAAIEALRQTPPPPIGGGGSLDGMMLTWTRGALHSAHQLIERTRKNHAGDPGESERDYEVVLMTDGDWTCPDSVGQNCNEDPAPEAARLRAAGIPVHVIAFGDATMQTSLNEVALQGGTGTSIDATSPQGIVDAFKTVLDRIRDGVIVPTCTQKLPRVLITMDASTSMLVGDAPGETKWDKARFALSGNPAAPNPGDDGFVEPVLTRKISVGGRQVAIEDVVHLGMVAFGAADEQELMAGFGPCMRDNFAWAMDPATSCSPPGCNDPYGGGPLQWTFRNSDSDRQPPFVRTTHSYMPACLAEEGGSDCAGPTPTTFTGQGLEFARKVIADYKQKPAPFKLGDSTRFVNVLITDGQTSEGSSDVESVLRAMVAEGVDTYVIGFGSGDELDRDQLDRYAGWGNTQGAIVVDPEQGAGAGGLADALEGVVTSLGLDSCCVLNVCAEAPEPADPSAVCGDGRVDGDEVCDDGPDNATYGHCGGRCDAPHLHCGDGRRDDPEECDDANETAGDGCESNCLRTGDADEDAGTSETPPAARPVAGTGGAGGRRGGRRTVAEAGIGGAPGLFPLDNPPDAEGERSTPDSGCGCHVVGAGSQGHSGVVALGLFALAVLIRRSRRR